MLGSIGQYRVRPASNAPLDWYLVRLYTPKLIHSAAKDLHDFPLWVPSTMYVAPSYKRQVTKYSPIWPEYILVGITNHAKLVQLDKVIRHSKIADARFVPTKISDEDVAWLDGKCRKQLATKSLSLKTGRDVELISGPFTGIPGRITASYGSWITVRIRLGCVQYYIKILKSRAIALLSPSTAYKK